MISFIGESKENNRKNLFMKQKQTQTQKKIIYGFQRGKVGEGDKLESLGLTDTDYYI